MENIENIITVPYTTAPKMTRNTGDVYNNNPSIIYIRNKKIQLYSFDSDLYGQTHLCTSENIIEKCESYLGKPITGNIKQFAMNFEEDVAIMHNGILSAICFCFPSSWIPCTGLNRTLEQIHSPVADGDHLRKVSSKLAKTMADPVLGSFTRYVWTINNIPNLSNHPKVKETYNNTDIQFHNLYFRVEKQTTLPLTNGITSLFFVKVEVTPLYKIWESNKQKIIDSINSMSPNIIQYKNLDKIKQIINNYKS